MRRRKFLVGGIVMSAVAPALGAEESAEGPAGKPLLASPLVLMAPSESGVVAVFAVTRLAFAHLELRRDGHPAQPQRPMTAFGLTEQGDGVFRIKVEGLSPGETCEVRAVVRAIDGEPATEETEWMPFHTLDAGAAATSILIWNDTHQHDETIRQLDDLAPTADFMIWNGDTCNDWHHAEQLVPALLAPGGRAVTRGRPLFLAMGNHDVRGKFAFRLPEIVALPENRPYFSVRSGPVALIFLDTGEDKPDQHPSFGGRVAFEPFIRAQAEWLAAEIEKPGIADAPYRLIICHIPLRGLNEVVEVDYANGGYDGFSRRGREAWRESLLKWRAQAVISGHTHRATLIPADQEHPFAQIIGGGPQAENARFITIHADATELRVEVRDLGEQLDFAVGFLPVPR